MLCVRAVSAAMKKQEPRTINGRNGPRDIGRGSIINLGSGESYVGVAGQLASTSAKHAVMGITKVAGKCSLTSRQIRHAGCSAENI